MFPAQLSMVPMRDSIAAFPKMYICNLIWQSPKCDMCDSAAALPYTCICTLIWQLSTCDMRDSAASWSMQPTACRAKRTCTSRGQALTAPATHTRWTLVREIARPALSGRWNSGQGVAAPDTNGRRNCGRVLWNVHACIGVTCH